MNLLKMFTPTDKGVKSVLVTEIELKDGTKTAVVSILNPHLIDFEEINRGLNFAMQWQKGVINKYATTVYTLKNEQLKKFTQFKEVVF